MINKQQMRPGAIQKMKAGEKFDKNIFFYVFSSILLLTFLPNSCMGATIHGNIYTFDLETAQNVLLEVNSTPRQTYVSKSGDYRFELPKGTYSITATKSEGTGTLHAEETINLENDGSYNIDLFLMTVIGDNPENYSDINVENIINYSRQKSKPNNYILVSIILGTIIIILLLTIAFLKNKRKRIKNKGSEDKPERLKKMKHRADDKNPENKTEFSLKEKILEEIELLEGRATQKDIRKKIPYSESKISLVITELEHEGKIRKIKKGRGNIIIINK